jgi:glycine cleavage system H protein
VNEAVSETGELINEDPYGAGWLVKVKLSDTGELEKLLDADAYQDLLKNE